MSRIDELKKQHPLYALSAIDIYKMISPGQSNKYIEMLIKLDKDPEYDYQVDHRARLIEQMAGEWGLDYNYLETLDLETLLFLINSVNSLMYDGKVKLFSKFASYNERKLIENNDVTTYSKWDEIEQAVSLAEIKLIDKETAKQIKKIYEDDVWLSLRPLSLEASMKYGANTKWCTTTESGQHYARYSSRGILIYNINKKTGYKVACFKNLDSNFDSEFSWWDVTDRRIEALDSEAPSAVLEAIRNEIKNTSVANQLLMTKAEADKLEIYKDGRSFDSGPSIGNAYRTGGIIDHVQSSGTTLNWNPSTGTSTNLTYNPGTYTTGTTLTTGGISSYTTTGNVGIGNINPSSQLSVHGDMEINGDVILRSDGVERARLTPDGLQFSGTTSTQEYNHFDEGPTEEQRRLMAELRFRDGDRIAEDAQQRLDDAMAEQMAEANERVAEKHLSLLDNIELGTLDNDMKIKMQMLAGIKTNQRIIEKLEADIERLRSEEAQPEVVHSSIWNKIKNTGRKLSSPFTNRLRKRIGALPMSVSARLEAVKQSQEL
jgi:hypothetical protein